MNLVLPTAARTAAVVDPAPSPKAGTTLRLGLLHNCKPNGDVILAAAHAALVERGLARADAVHRVKHTAGEGMRGDVQGDLLHCDLVLTALAC